MTLRTSLLISAASALILLGELVLYFSMGMPAALESTGLSTVISYKFLWLIVLTASAGILAPVSAILEGFSERKNIGISLWIILIGLAMVAFTSFSFQKASSQAPKQMETQRVPVPVKETPNQGKSEALPTVEFVDAAAQMASPDTFRLVLRFKNNADRPLRQILYTVIVSNEANEILLSTNMREDVFIPPGFTAGSKLEWNRGNFPNPVQFETLSQDVGKGTVKVSVTLEKGVSAE